MSLNMKAARKRGSLLLEALLAIVILSVSIVVIIRSMSESAQGVAYNINYTKALMLLENKIFDALRNPAVRLPANDQGRFDFPDNEFSYRMQTSERLRTDTAALENVDLSVEWGSPGHQQRLPFSTYRFVALKQ